MLQIKPFPKSCVSSFFFKPNFCNILSYNNFPCRFGVALPKSSRSAGDPPVPPTNQLRQPSLSLTHIFIPLFLSLQLFMILFLTLLPSQ